MDSRFRVEVISQTPNPQQTIYAALHQDYSDEFVWDNRESFPSEEGSGAIAVKRLLAGNKGHFGSCEHPQIVLNCGWFPHSTMQQIRTHRVGMCLSGDSQVFTKTASGGIRKISIRDLCNRWKNGRSHQQSEADADYARRRIAAIPIYNLNEDTLEFGTTNISQVYCNGVKSVYLVKTSEGQSIKASQDHLFFTDKGWARLGELRAGDSITTRCFAGRGSRSFVPPISAHDAENEQWKPIPDVFGYEASSLGRIRSFHARNGKGMTETARLKKLSESRYLFYSANNMRRNAHVDVLTVFRGSKPSQGYVARHLDGNAYNNRIENLAWGTEKENREDQRKTTGFNCCKARFVPIVSIEYAGEEETYDLEVVGPYHNFLANDLVVHNSFDVQSGRYTSERYLKAAAVIQEACDRSHRPSSEQLAKTVAEYTHVQDAVEDVVYLRPVGYYSDRQGHKYFYDDAERLSDLTVVAGQIVRFAHKIEMGWAEEHARGLMPFDVRQHWVMSLNVRSLMHLLDMRSPANAQLECQQLCELIIPHFKAWVPDIAEWYIANRLHKSRLAP